MNEVIRRRHNGYDPTKQKHPTDLDFKKVPCLLEEMQRFTNLLNK